jgi:hypothetical protein
MVAVDIQRLLEEIKWVKKILRKYLKIQQLFI